MAKGQVKMTNSQQQNKQKAKSVDLTSDNLDGHFSAFLDKCSQETTSTAQEGSQPELSKQDQHERSAQEEGSLWPDASVSCSRSQSCSRSPASKHKSDDKKKDSSSRRDDHQSDSRCECSDSCRDGDHGADPTPDIEGVTPVAEAIPEVLLIHILQEGITPAGGPGHGPDPGPGLGLTGEDQGLIPALATQDQN